MYISYLHPKCCEVVGIRACPWVFFEKKEKIHHVTLHLKDSSIIVGAIHGAWRTIVDHLAAQSTSIVAKIRSAELYVLQRGTHILSQVVFTNRLRPASNHVITLFSFQTRRCQRYSKAITCRLKLRRDQMSSCTSRSVITLVHKTVIMKILTLYGSMGIKSFWFEGSCTSFLWVLANEDERLEIAVALWVSFWRIACTCMWSV